MTFVFPILLGGLALIAVPILLHLIFRQKPRRLQFPAFRFLIKRHRTNLRKLQLRHILLLALRILLIAAICLALARPKLFYTELNLSSDRPVAAVFILDTSYSMEYATSDKQSRLDEAKKRAVELLDELPDGSRIAVLDSAETALSRGNWQSKAQARQRITGLTLQHKNAPLTRNVQAAYRMFGELVRSTDDESARQLPRLLCVFSDRMRACWDVGQQQLVNDAHDQVPPLLEGLQQLRGDIPALVSELGALRSKLPPASGSDYPEQALIAALEKLRGHIGELRREDLPTDPELAKLIPGVRRATREILQSLQGGDPKEATAKDYRNQLIDKLVNLSREVQGAYGIFVDVGVEKPVDLSIADLQLPRDSNAQVRQVFSEDENIIVRVPVQAIGKDYDNEVICQIGGNTLRQARAVKAGERVNALFELDPGKLRLAPGLHQLEVRLGATDSLPFNNSRYLTFAIREPQRVLVIADEVRKADYFKQALLSLQYKVDVQPVVELLKAPQEILKYDAAYLFGVANPNEAVWAALSEYGARGGRLGIVPGGNELQKSAYNSEAAQKLLPGIFKDVVTFAKSKEDESVSGFRWDLSQDVIFQHPLLRPFREWRANKSIDFIAVPAEAYSFWDITPGAKGTALVEYVDPDQKHYPALLERVLDEGKTGGRVLLFTTTLDARDPKWNDYLSSTSSFYIVLTGLSTRHLAGSLEEPILNFECGRDVPTMRLPLTARYRDYIIRGPVFERMTETEGVLRLEKANKPGNYVVEGVKNAADGGTVVGRFSVNMPALESDLTRVPVAEIDFVLGPKAVTTVEKRANIRSVLRGHFSEPLELFPFLMVLLLVVLALENLLANKFYKKESLPEDV